MRKVMILALAGTFAGSLAACSQTEVAEIEPTADEQIAEAEAAVEQRAETVAASETLSEAQAFLDDIAQTGAIQVGMAKIAAEEASRDGVKQFAEAEIKTQQKLLMGLRDVAEGATANLQVETVLSDEQERNFAQLRGANSIDDMFLERTRANYRELEERLADYAANGAVESLKIWATEAQQMLADSRTSLAAI